MLVDLVRGKVVLNSVPSRSEKVGGWDAVFKAADLPPHDASTVSFAGEEMRFTWRSHFVAAAPGPISDEARKLAESKGWTLIELPETSSSGPPASLVAVFQD